MVQNIHERGDTELDALRDQYEPGYRAQRKDEAEVRFIRALFEERTPTHPEGDAEGFCKYSDRVRGLHQRYDQVMRRLANKEH